MQLFTIGLYQLNDDGSRKLDSSGNPFPPTPRRCAGPRQSLHRLQLECPRQQQRHRLVQLLPRRCSRRRRRHSADDQLPSHHSTAEKDFLGVTIGASGNPDPNGDLKIASILSSTIPICPPSSPGSSSSTSSPAIPALPTSSVSPTSLRMTAPVSAATSGRHHRHPPRHRGP